MKLAGLQSRSGHDREEKNSQPPPEFEPPIIQPVAQYYTTELSRVLFGVGKYVKSGTVIHRKNTHKFYVK
jgi:hypothetical protein